MTDPWSLDAERAVLGALMISPAAYHRIADQLREADFYAADHRAIWRCIDRLARAGEPCDAVTVGEMLEKEGRGDLLALAVEAQMNTPGAGSVAAYARIVAQHAEHRRVRAAGREIAEIDADRVAEAPAILAAAQSPASGSLISMRDALKVWYEDLDRRYQRGAELSGVPTGLTELDAITHGLQPSDLIIVGARPSMGKTAFALHLVRACAATGKGALVFSIEMPVRDLANRIVSAIARVSSDALRSPADMDQDAWPRISAALSRMNGWPIWYDESGAITADAICARARQQHAKGALSLIVIDYLQLVQVAGDNRNEALGAVTRALKLLAKSLGVAVVLLSQLNRGLEARANKRPMMSDLRDSGAIEQDADLIAFLYRDEVYDANSRDKGHTEIIIAKHRNGRVGTVPVRSQMMFGTYHDAPDGLPSASAQEDQRQGFKRRKPSS